MTGAEHYQQAEQLLETAQSGRDQIPFAHQQFLTQLAQTHATLALAHAAITEVGGWER